MQILFYFWNSLTDNDIITTFRQMQISFDQLRYNDTPPWEDDDNFYEYLLNAAKSKSYDVIFSIDFCVPLARVANELNIPYISWSYDSPLTGTGFETFGFPTTFIFQFDRADIERIKPYIPINSHIYHLPLAVDTKRFDKYYLSSRERKLYSSEISFIGSLYENGYLTLINRFSDYYREYFNALYDVQFVTYGIDLLFDAFSENILKEVSTPKLMRTINYDEDYVFTPAYMRSLTYKHIAYKERIVLLELLARKYKVDLYSQQKCDVLNTVNYRGIIDNVEGGPKVFKASNINLNITIRKIMTGIPQRCLDIMAAGGFLLSNYQQELWDYCSDSCILYDSIEDAYEKVGYYLSHEAERIEIAQNAHKNMLENFRYEDRIKTMFNTVGLKKF